MFKPPSTFDFRKPELWPDWKTRFQRFRIAAKLDKEDEVLQINSLLYAMGTEAEKVFNQLTFTAGEANKFDILIQKLDAYFTPKVNIIHERSLFHSRIQQADENIEAYVRALHDMAARANFRDKDETIRDRLVLGVKDRELSQKLQMTPELTLKMAVDMARQQEQVKEQMTAQRSDNLDAVSVHGPSRGNAGGQRSGDQRNNRGNAGDQRRGDQRNYRGSRRGRRGRGGAADGQRSGQPCPRCGRDKHDGTVCPAMGKTCRGCGKTNHFQRVCRSRAAVDAVTTDSYFLGSLNSEPEDPPWRVSLLIAERVVSFKIDTGADVSVISETDWKQMSPRPKLHASRAKLDSPGGPVRNLGQFIAKTDLKGKPVSFRVFVLEGKRIVS